LDRTYLELLDVVEAASWVGDVDVAGVVDVAAGVGGDFADSHWRTCQLEVVIEGGRSVYFGRPSVRLRSRLGRSR
jgi:hypothetical protein